MSSVAVIGGGSWGIALAVQAARAGRAVTLWVHSAASHAELAERRESHRLPGVRLPGAVRVTAAMPEAADVTLLVVPVQHMRVVLADLPPRPTPLVACSKGVEAGSHRLPLEILDAAHPAGARAVRSGPNFAHEVARGLPAAAVVASGDAATREHVASLLATPSFRLYGSSDPVGAQLGGAAKNVIAIAAGVVSGLGLGENARAALITRGLAELGRLAAALGARPETTMGLSGLGDLLLTCTGPSSRNFSLGVALGRGEALHDVLAARDTVAEGVTTAPALIGRAPDIDLPICRAVARLLAGTIGVQDAVEMLLARPRKDE